MISEVPVSNASSSISDVVYKDLGDCIELIIDHRGKTPKKLGGDWTSRGVRAISAKNVNGGRLVNEDTIRHVSHVMYEKWMKEDVKVGDCFLVSEGATLGECMYWDYDYPVVLSQRIFCIRTNPEILYPKFFYVYMNSEGFQSEINGRSTGSSVFGLRQTDLLKMKVRILPLAQQKIIGDTYYNLNKKIELNRQISQTLEQIAQTIFKSWFVNFEPVKAKIEAKAAGRDPERAAMCAISGKLEPELDQLSPEQYQQLAATAALFPDELVESELGLIPVGWEVSSIGNEVEVVGGSTPSTVNPDLWDGDFAWVTPKDLSRMSEKVLTGSERTISAAGVSKISSGQLPVGTVLLSSRAPIGYLALTMIPVSINQGFIAMLCNKRLPNTYALQWATANLDAIKQRGSGTTFAEISKSNFRPMSVLLPDIETLNVFHLLVLPLYEQISANVQEVKILAALRDILLPKLLIGELNNNMS
jgi:type I restriction enzyme S subunit